MLKTTAGFPLALRGSSERYTFYRRWHLHAKTHFMFLVLLFLLCAIICGTLFVKFFLCFLSLCNMQWWAESCD